MVRGRSRPVAGIGYLGPIPDGVWGVLTYAWEAPIYLASNFAREFAPQVAFAASMGWLSTITPDGLSYSRQWHITKEGLVALETSSTL